MYDRCQSLGKLNDDAHFFSDLFGNFVRKVYICSEKSLRKMRQNDKKTLEKRRLFYKKSLKK